MQNFFQWFDRFAERRAKPWLIVGKGPTYGNIGAFGPEGYHLFGLNHVVRDRPVLLTHAVDIDVVADCAEAIDANARFLVVPWIPHKEFRPREKTLQDYVGELPILAKLQKEGRLLTYDAETAPASQRRGEGPVVPLSYFSAEAALGLLALGGEKTIHTIGIDGGTAYARDFKDLEASTRLSNAQQSFDIQFEKFAQILYRTKARLHPLGIQAPVKVFVGAEPEQELAVEVLADSIQRFSSIAVDVVSLAEANIPIPQARDPANRGKTPFSFQRFLIPQLCGYEGLGVYVDSDMQVFKDIRNFWSVSDDDFDLRTVKLRPGSGRVAQNSVLLLNCARLKWEIGDIVARLDRGEITYKRLMEDMVVNNRPPERVIPHVWNDLEHYEPGVTSLIHYTDMIHQPWVSHNNPLGWVWFEALFAAVDDGAVSPELVERSIRLAHVRPTVGIQLEKRIADGRRLKVSDLAADADFVAPWQHLTGHLKPGAHLPKGFVWQVQRQLARFVPGL
ncbi:hypothetical protein V5F53_07800 [Xanthobacter sp. V4C-4]|uniref:hypothetical protein n=1 Tax=Xanthobacter cornucopiae TaxID=3119924 RepID=UPI003728FDD6